MSDRFLSWIVSLMCLSAIIFLLCENARHQNAMHQLQALDNCEAMRAVNQVCYISPRDGKAYVKELSYSNPANHNR